jgi:hypothetical protein
MNSFWSINKASAWRAWTSLNGGSSKFGRIQATEGSEAVRRTVTPCCFRNGTMSDGTVSQKSTSPVTSAFAAVAGSGMICQTTRSTLTMRAPAAPSGASVRGA